MRVLEEVKRLALELLGGLPATLYPDIEEALKTAVHDDDGRDAPVGGAALAVAARLVQPHSRPEGRRAVDGL